METHELRAVFTPATPAVVSFIERESINDQLVSAIITPGKQIIVYGHSGSGKTTLLYNKLYQTYEHHVTTRCMRGMTFDDLVQNALRHLNAMAVESVEVKEATTVGARIGRKRVAEVSGTRTSESLRIEKSIVNSKGTIDELGVALGMARACWVLEDFHKIDGEEKTRLAQAMKLVMDMAVDYPELKIVAVGAVDSARQVVEYDLEMRNRVAEICVPLMSNSELERIVKKGALALNCEVDSRYSGGMILLSNGLPAVTHQLCLHYFDHNGIERTCPNRRILGANGYREAIASYVNESSDTLKKAFDGALVRNKRASEDHFSLILKALTKFGQDGAQGFEILGVIRSLKPNYRSSNFQRYLKNLTGSARHGVLRFDPNSQRYSFSEPIFRAFASAFFAQKSHVDPRPKDVAAVDEVLRVLIPEIVKKLSRIDDDVKSGSLRIRA